MVLGTRRRSLHLEPSHTERIIGGQPGSSDGSTLQTSYLDSGRSYEVGTFDLNATFSKATSTLEDILAVHSMHMGLSPYKHS